jgi:CRP-like cAMP-binding protein
MNLHERLRETPCFSDLEPSELEALANAMELLPVDDGELLVREGERGDACYFIVEGRVRVSHEHEGQATTLSDLEPGELFGLVSLIDGGKRSASCRAAGPTVVARLDASAFTMLHEGSPALVLHFQKLVARQLARDARRLNRALVQAMLEGKAADSGPEGSLSGEFHLSSGS